MINNREDAQRLVDQCRYLASVPVVTCTDLYALHLPVPCVSQPVQVPICAYLYLKPRGYVAGDLKLIVSPGTLPKASVPGVPQELLLEISTLSRPMTM